MQRGLVHIYCGDGKGKTTAALGLCLRAHGRGKKILWTSFLKSYDSGEFLRDMPFDLEAGHAVDRFVISMTEQEKQAVREEHERRLEAVFKKAAEQDYDILVLDEAMAAVQLRMIDPKRLIALIKEKPEKLEIVLTGRNPSSELLDMADYVSEIKVVKHPFDKGTEQRMGIER